jgi:hypothetical protein
MSSGLRQPLSMSCVRQACLSRHLVLLSINPFLCQLLRSPRQARLVSLCGHFHPPGPIFMCATSLLIDSLAAVLVHLHQLTPAHTFAPRPFILQWHSPAHRATNPSPDAPSHPCSIPCYQLHRVRPHHRHFCPFHFVRCHWPLSRPVCDQPFHRERGYAGSGDGVVRTSTA